MHEPCHAHRRLEQQEPCQPAAAVVAYAAVCQDRGPRAAYGAVCVTDRAHGHGWGRVDRAHVP